MKLDRFPEEAPSWRKLNSHGQIGLDVIEFAVKPLASGISASFSFISMTLEWGGKTGGNRHAPGLLLG